MIQSSSQHSWLLIALLLIPLAGSLIVALLRDQRAAKFTAFGISLVEFALAACMWGSFHGDGARIQMAFSVPWIPDFDINIAFGIDGIAMVMVLMIAVLSPIVIGGSWTEKLAEGRSHSGFFSLLLLMEALTIGVFATTDVFVFYVLFEIMLIPMYFLIGRFGGNNRQYAAVKFFLYSFLGGLLMLGGAIGAYVYAESATGQGTFDWMKLTSIVSHAPLHVQVWIFLGFFAAFAIKAPLVPLHTWLPDATREAPVAAGVMLVGVLDKVGVFGFLRYSIPLTPEASKTLAPLVLTLAVIGVLYGSLLAAGQSDMKRFIAYVSVAHFGFIALGVFAFTQQSGVGSVTYMVNHSISTGMFLIVIGMLAARGKSARIADYGGLAKVTPLLAGAFFIAGLTTLSLPGTNSFISEFLVLLGAYPSQPAFTIFAAVGMVLAALYVLWLYQRVFTGPVRGDALVGLSGGPGAAMRPDVGARKGFGDLGVRERWVLAPLLVLVIGLGFYPQPLLDKVGPAVADTLSSVGVQGK
ncbi:NADH-quinone oxidoreductase subunit M [Sciscionella sediminilitoris]|uniref:NADH-quinone oxidoreductase subunit M n=1 Tax=Sciscionella sediminilitoris TaxID=1445613 RepID=UPI0004DF28CC|nr:NADH-quinone oxidoreductase subunit M [Sciscionella sp. SE31]